MSGQQELEINQVIEGDCLEIMKQIPDNSIDLVPTESPYFLINDSGSGFMASEWDSLNIGNGFEILCKSEEFADFVASTLLLMRLESSTVGEERAQENVSMDSLASDIDSKGDALFAERRSKEPRAKIKSEFQFCSMACAYRDSVRAYGYLREVFGSR